ncbi:hypothetical protein BT63DRAFT_227747 [Microthyrium microscopicum]|uniref:Nucleolar protein 16 n=1 Tax=Microthyrium microscopicum TaxID=703497 RepID=A0A6A6UCX8_9PEZI|nr:hypothetical protein BT63DRAFT_227747 [Microthyrium microscopicum]
MGRELQKRKRRSGAQPVRRPPKNDKKILNNPYIRDNWNKKETLTQNYRRLGLVAQLNKRAGGTHKPTALADTPLPTNPFAILPGTTYSTTRIEEVALERDEAGNIIVADTPANPLNDQLNELEEDEENWITPMGHVGTQTKGVARTSVTEALEQMAREGRRKRPRHQSEREEEWVGKLVEKYGEDYAGMFRDRKLNVMQQSQGDLKKRVKKWLVRREMEESD